MAPYMMPARPSRKISSPIVTITALSGGLLITGRMMVRSSTAPSSRPDSSAAPKPSQ